MNLRYGIKEFRVLNYNDLDEFINTHFDFDEPYECLTSEEWVNYSYHLFNVDGKLSSWNKKYVEEAIEKRESGTGLTRSFLNYLCSKGKLPPGKYLVEASW